jgi:hypothetical protein
MAVPNASSVEATTVGAGVLVAHATQDIGGLRDALRADVVAGMREAQADIGAGGEIGRAVGVLVHDDDLAAAGGAPAEDRRHVGHRARGVDAEVEEPDARIGEDGHHAERVAGHIGHLRGGRAAAEARVETLRIGEAGAEQGWRHQLGVRGERQGVPGDQAALDGALEPPDAGRILRVEVIPDEPRAGRPDEGRTPGVLGEEVLAGGDRLRDELLVILLSHALGVIGEADIEMGLVDEVDGRSGHDVSVISLQCRARRGGC